MSDPIYLDNDHLIEKDITQPATATGVSEAAGGLTGLTGHISSTPAGATIDAALSVSLSERSSTTGRYFGVLEGDDLRTHLASLVGRTVYEVVGDGTNVYVSDARVVRDRRPSS